MPNRLSSSVQVFYPRWTKDVLIRDLQSKLPLLADRLPLARVVLFGSYAKGRSTAASDIDLLIVYRGERREDAYVLVRKILNVPHLEPHVYTLDEFEDARTTIERMVRDGVVLHG